MKRSKIALLSAVALATTLGTGQALAVSFGDPTISVGQLDNSLELWDLANEWVNSGALPALKNTISAALSNAIGNGLSVSSLVTFWTQGNVSQEWTSSTVYTFKNASFSDGAHSGWYDSYSSGSGSVSLPGLGGDSASSRCGIDPRVIGGCRDDVSFALSAFLMSVAEDTLTKTLNVTMYLNLYANATDVYSVDQNFNAMNTVGKSAFFGKVTFDTGVRSGVSVPGPIAGAGLPAALALMGFAAWRRRQLAV